MRTALAVLAIIHGIAHLVGFVVPWQFITSAEQPYRTTILQGRLDLGDWGIRLYGLGWLALSLCFAIVAVGVLRRSSWWLVALEGGVALSLVFCALDWPATRLGLFANVTLLGFAFAAIRYEGGGLAIKNEDLNSLWRPALPGVSTRFDRDQVDGLPRNARLYLEHAIAAGAPLASTVRLKMHGEIKLGRWLPFRAEQVISREGSFVWAATVSMYGLPIMGSDSLLRGEGEMRWKLFDLIPVMTAAGPDITRSAIGRLQAELVGMHPAALLERATSWSNGENGYCRVSLDRFGETAEITLGLDSNGSLKSVEMLRWGNPDGGEYGYFKFGAVFDEERSFDGFTIPSRIQAGWYFGSAHFNSEGAFFRAVIDAADYR